MTSFDGGSQKFTSFPLVCICIPTYNAAATIRETLESILAQTYPNLVIHVSDNASTDNTLTVVKTIADPRVYIHENVENVGGEGNFNRCIQLAEGKYTAIYHADDIYEQDIVAKQVAHLETHSMTGAVFAAATIIDANGVGSGVIGRVAASNGNVSIYDFPLLFKDIAKRGNFIVCPSAMVRTQIYKDDIRQWRGDQFRSSADLDVWFRVAKLHSVAFLREALMRYRVDNDQFSSSVRLRTERADFLLVMDHYLCTPDVRLLLTDEDQRNYRQLVINDKLWRAINQFSKGNLLEARQLMRGIFNLDALRGALTSQRGFLMFITSAALFLMIAMQFKNSGPRMVRALRGKLNK